jgi:hypothetical protein
MVPDVGMIITSYNNPKLKIPLKTDWVHLRGEGHPILEKADPHL